MIVEDGCSSHSDGDSERGERERERAADSERGRRREEKERVCGKESEMKGSCYR